jgi:hypothetical protein
MQHITDFVCNIILALLWLVALAVGIVAVLGMIAFSIVACLIGALIMAVTLIRDGNIQSAKKGLFLKL